MGPISHCELRSLAINNVLTKPIKMKQSIFLHSLVALALALAFPAIGQRVILNTTGTLYPTTLTGDARSEVVESAQKALDTYADLITLLDKKQNRVTIESMNKFMALFGGTATLVQDYEQYVPLDMVDRETYCGNIYNRMELEGLQVRLNQAILEEIIDEEQFWVVVIKTEKDFYNYVTSNNEVVTTGGRIQDHEIRLDIPKSDISKPKIAKISRRCRPEDKCDVVVADYSRYFGPSFSVLQPLVVPETKKYGGYLGDVAEAGTLELEADFGFSGGIEFFTNRLSPKESGKKNVFLLTGIRFNYNKYTGNLTDYNFEVPDEAYDTKGNQQVYQRNGFNINATEKLTVGTVEVPLGIAFRLKRKQRFDAFLQTKLLASYSFLMGTGTLTGTGDYDARIPPANWSLLEDRAARPDEKVGDIAIFDQNATYGPFLGGEHRTLNGNTKPKLNGIGVAAQLSPVVTFHLSDGNPNWSLMIGADITYHFLPLFKYKESDEILLRYPGAGATTQFNKNINNDQSLLQFYLKEITLANIGIRVGLVHRFLDEP